MGIYIFFCYLKIHLQFVGYLIANVNIDIRECHVSKIIIFILRNFIILDFISSFCGESLSNTEWIPGIKYKKLN